VTAASGLRHCDLIMPRHNGAVALSVEGRRLSVCPSVSSVPDPKSRTENLKNLREKNENLARKEAHDMGDL